MRAGGLRHHVIEIQKPVTVKDDYGAMVDTWVTHITTRADIDFKRGERVLDIHEKTSSYSVDFRIRRYHEVDETMRVLFNGRKYRINFIPPIVDRQMQVLSTTLINE